MSQYIYDQYGDIVRTVKIDNNTGDFQTIMEIEADNIIAQNKALRDNQTGKEAFRHVGTIPAPIVEKSMIEGWFHDDKKWEQWLNDSENRAWRSWEGRV